MFILLSGNDEFSAHEELARIHASGDFGYNQDTFAGESADLAAIRNACETMPFLAEKRLVVVEGLPKPPRRKGKEGDEDAEDEGVNDNGDDDEDSASAAMAPVARGARGKRGKAPATTGLSPQAFAKGVAAIVPTLPETTMLVVLVPSELKADNPLTQAARRYGKSHVFTKPKGAQLEDWVKRRARSQNRRLSVDAARLLVESLGDDLRMLASEVDKLGTYAGENGEIDAEAVQALTPIGRELKAFDLTDALARRDNKAAIALLHELLAQGESPFLIIGMVAFQTRSLLQVKALAEKGMSSYKIAEVSGMAPFVVEKSLRLARQFSFAQLEAAHRSLLEIDTSLKRSRMTPEMALDLLALEFGKTS